MSVARAIWLAAGGVPDDVLDDGRIAWRAGLGRPVSFETCQMTRATLMPLGASASQCHGHAAPAYGPRRRGERARLEGRRQQAIVQKPPLRPAPLLPPPPVPRDAEQVAALSLTLRIAREAPPFVPPPWCTMTRMAVAVALATLLAVATTPLAVAAARTAAPWSICHFRPALLAAKLQVR